MIKAYKNFYKNYFNFSGRSSRRDFWWVYLGNFLISLLLLSFFLVSTGLAVALTLDWDGFSFLTYLFLALLIGWLLLPAIGWASLGIRRLRDAGINPLWWLLLPLSLGLAELHSDIAEVISILLFVAIVILMLFPTNQKAHFFGRTQSIAAVAIGLTTLMAFSLFYLPVKAEQVVFGDNSSISLNDAKLIIQIQVETQKIDNSSQPDVTIQVAANISDKSATTISNNAANTIIQKETQEKGAVAIEDYPKPIASLLQQLVNSSVSEAAKSSETANNSNQVNNGEWGILSVSAATKQSANYTTPQIAAIFRSHITEATKIKATADAVANKKTPKIPLNQPAITWKDSNTIFAAARLTYLLNTFKSLEKTNGAWDLAHYKSLNLKGTYYVYGNKGSVSDIGNIHFGYMGRILGFSNITLRVGEQYYSLSTIKRLDQPQDYKMVRIGMDLYSKGVRF
ncbi:MAG: DUF805 domain-containing protein [Streptococcaceae bacterium]|jgi:uncharacterized membrane protein YhaH (DUF805 family)|nr:DUF805 domain-containing protein [Streptococcaceae bacterium]